MVRKLHIALLFVLLLPALAFAQSGKITGKVLDAKTGEGLPGANILVKELGRGVASDIDGNYTLSLLDPGTYTLNVSFVGFKNKTVSVQVGTQEVSQDIELDADFFGLDEVVVTGVGTETSKRKLAVSVESVGGDELRTSPVTSIDQALTGKIAGATITNIGMPGAGASIQLRGINTFGNTTPLIIVDGIEVESSSIGTSPTGGDNQGVSLFAGLDLSNVEKIEVVKGAAASALYGAQGANGVINIITKKGTAGQTRISFSATNRFDQFQQGNVTFTNKHGYATDANGNIAGLSYDATKGVWSAIDTDLTGQINKEYKLNGEPLQMYDNLGAIMQDGNVSEYSINVSGGDRNSTYSLSASTMDQSGIERFTNFERKNFGVNYTTNVSDAFKINAKVDVSNSGSVGNTESGNNVESPLSYVLTTDRYTNIEDKDPVSGYYWPNQTIGNVTYNGLFYKQINTKELVINRFMPSVNLNYKPFRFLEVDYKLGVDHYNAEFKETQLNSSQIQPDYNPLFVKEGYVNADNYKQTKINTILTAFLRLNLKEDFKIDLPITSSTQVAYDYRQTDYDRISAYGTGLPTLRGLNTLASTGTPSTGQYVSEFTTYGFLLNQRFDYGETAGLSFGGRYDRSSAFNEGERVEFFPRGDAYLRLSGFDFWNSIEKTVTDFKIRAAYGEAGTQPSPFQRIVTLSQGIIGANGTLSSQTSISNVNLGVQVSKESEFGGNMTFKFGDTWFSSLDVDFTYFNRINDFVIQGVAVAPSTGATSVVDNAFKLNSDGFDFTISALVAYTKNFNWTSTVTFGTNKTTVDDISNGQPVTLSVESGNLYYFNEGDVYGAHYGFPALTSVDQVDADGDRYIPLADVGNYSIVDGRVVSNSTKAIQYKTTQEIIGDPTPDFTMGFRNEFALFNNLRLAMQWDWVNGGDIYNGTKQRMYQSFTHGDVSKEITVGTETGAYAQYYWSAYKTGQKNDFFIEDGSYMRLRELTVSYDIAPHLSFLGSSNPIKNLIVSASGRNLLTITDYTGFDPEVTEGGSASSTRGYDYNSFPNFRSFSFGIKANF